MIKNQVRKLAKLFDKKHFNPVVDQVKNQTIN